MNYPLGISTHANPASGSQLVQRRHAPSTSVSAERPAAEGLGSMSRRQLAVGSGAQKAEAASVTDGIKTGGLRFGQFLLAVVTLPASLLAGAGLLLAALIRAIDQASSGVSSDERNQAREKRAEKRYVQSNRTMIRALCTPQGRSISRNVGVMDRLKAHAELTGKQMSRKEIMSLVVAGENIAKALQDPVNAGGGSPLALTVNGATHQVASNTFTARALGWYMMASAASQDVVRNALGDTSTSDMTTSGSYIMKDPGQRIYKFLNAAPTAAARMSTHFEERLGHQNEHYVLGFIPTFGKSAQKGIEDFQSRMPGQGGTMLFDTLRPDAHGTPELFVKFESAGCPPYFSAESHHGFKDIVTRFFASLERNIHHCVNFQNSKNTSGTEASTTVSRQEHMYKGTLAPSFAAVQSLIEDASASGLVERSAVSGAARSMKKLGVSAGLKAVHHVGLLAQNQGNQIMATKARSVGSMILSELDRLGLASDHHDIVRRGAEAHISLNPTEVAA